ncbi:MAG: hypothetical protein HN348_23940, partial [Proteobacteria bacterium]|nr:hypothetical protein [Pseudomonadota bacterium]
MNIKRTRKLTMRVLISVALLGMVLLTAAVLLLTSAHFARRSTLAVSRSFVDEVAETSRRDIAGYIEVANITSQLTIHHFETGLLDLDNWPEVERYFFDVLLVHDTIAMMNFADEQGQFLMVKRMDDGSLATKRIEIVDGQRQTTWSHRQPGVAVDDVLRVEHVDDDTYDPRVRPWYQKAMGAPGLHWSDAYVFWTGRSPGITASFTIGSGHAVGIDIGLRDFSTFLASLEVGQRGTVVVLDGVGQIVASPHEADLVREQQTPEGLKVVLGRAENSALREIAVLAASSALAEALKGEHRTLRYDVDDETWIGTLAPLTIVEGTTWVVGVVVPEEDFLVDIRRASRGNAIISGIFLILALIFSLRVSRWITNSLVDLVKQAQRIEKL